VNAKTLGPSPGQYTPGTFRMIRALHLLASLFSLQLSKLTIISPLPSPSSLYSSRPPFHAPFHCSVRHLHHPSDGPAQYKWNNKIRVQTAYEIAEYGRYKNANDTHTSKKSNIWIQVRDEYPITNNKKLFSATNKVNKNLKSYITH